jgi:hypothetical protein
MPPTIANDLVLATHHIKHDLTPREAVVTFAFDDGVNNLSAQAWADNLHALWSAATDQLLDSQAVNLSTTTVKGDGSVNFTTGTSVGLGVRGTNPMSSVAANTAILVQKKTAQGGRQNRGRVYLPWMLNEGELDEVGKISLTYIGTAQAAMTQYYTDIGASMVIANRVYDLPWDNPARQLIAITKGPPLTQLRVDTYAATQRRRMPRF